MAANLRVAEGEGSHASRPDCERSWLLTVHTLFRRPVFDDTGAARAVARLHRHSGPWSSSRCLAWVLLPESWRALVTVGAGDSIERLVQRFKSSSARLVDPRQRINGWLWERGFEAQLLPPDGERDCARRLVLEPLRAGLADAIGNYPYWDAVWLGEAAPGHDSRHVAGAGVAA